MIFSVGEHVQVRVSGWPRYRERTGTIIAIIYRYPLPAYLEHTYRRLTPYNKGMYEVRLDPTDDDPHAITVRLHEADLTRYRRQ